MNPADPSIDGTLDFGLASVDSTAAAGRWAIRTETPDRLTQAGIMVGTVAYMSPQQANGGDG